MTMASSLNYHPSDTHRCQINTANNSEGVIGLPCLEGFG